MDKIKTIGNKIIQIQLFRYFIVGGLATVVDWVSFYILAIIFIANYQIALIVAFILGSITNYILNRVFTFHSKSKKIAGQASVHLAISAISLLLNIALMYLLVSHLALEKMPSRVVVTLIMLIINFFMHKHITFNKKFFED